MLGHGPGVPSVARSSQGSTGVMGRAWRALTSVLVQHTDAVNQGQDAHGVVSVDGEQGGGVVSEVVRGRETIEHASTGPCGEPLPAQLAAPLGPVLASSQHTESWVGEPGLTNLVTLGCGRGFRSAPELRTATHENHETTVPEGRRKTACEAAEDAETHSPTESAGNPGTAHFPVTWRSRPDFFQARPTNGGGIFSDEASVNGEFSKVASLPESPVKGRVSPELGGQSKFFKRARASSNPIFPVVFPARASVQVEASAGQVEGSQGSSAVETSVQHVGLQGSSTVEASVLF